MTGTVYVFLDESGNLDFSKDGTKYFVLTSVCMTRPFAMSLHLDSYKYDCLERGLKQESFHCAEDNLRVRDRVFGLIADNIDGLRIDSVIVEKRKTGPALREDSRFYPEMLGYLLRYVVKGHAVREANEVIIITDTIPIHRKRQTVKGAIKGVLAEMMPEHPRYRLLHHDSRAHYGLQVADYCSWAIYRKHERRDARAYTILRSAVKSEFDIFGDGVKHYY